MSRLHRVSRAGRVLFLVLAVFAWTGAATYLAAEHGAHRRMTFDGSAR